jgi:hypothetical protein
MNETSDQRAQKIVFKSGHLPDAQKGQLADQVRNAGGEGGAAHLHVCHNGNSNSNSSSNSVTGGPADWARQDVRVCVCDRN